MKKFIAFLLVCLTVLSFCACTKKNNTSYIEGDLFFDVGASSINGIDKMTVINAGVPAEITLSSADIQLFEKYKYNENYSVPPLHELLLFPETKRLTVSVGSKTTTLYLLDDGAIVITLPDKEFKAYLAENKYLMTAKKYDSLVKKYTTK